MTEADSQVKAQMQKQQQAYSAEIEIMKKQNQADILTALEQEKKDSESKQDQTKRDHAKQMEEMNNFLSSKIEQNLQLELLNDELKDAYRSLENNLSSEDQEFK